ncbi:hypothetical protein JL720_12560 [Aureococcus anophagefferens]|nr:hypothetical protein JL720_12560 [Aureococcus anophagefferens]
MGNDVAKQAVSPLVGAVAAVQGKNKLRSVFGSKPAAGSIVFVGSQTFQNWDSLKKDMHGLPVVNCGFVGAMSKHLVTYAHHPFETFKRALREFRGVHPELPVVYVSPIVTPHHKDLGQALCQKFARLNRLVADYATGDALLYVVDVNDKAFSTDAFNYERGRRGAAADAPSPEEEPKAEPPAPPPVPIEGLEYEEPPVEAPGLTIAPPAADESEDPRGAAKAAAPEEPLPETPPYPLAAGDDDDPWEEKFDEHSGLPYFVHRVTGESAWDKPGAELCRIQQLFGLFQPNFKPL